MATRISSFPVLTAKMMEKIRFSPSDYSFYSLEKDIKKELAMSAIDSSSSVFKLKDENNIDWVPENGNLCMERVYTLQSYKSLFGPQGVAAQKSSIGLAVIWTSKESKRRGAFKIGTFNFDDPYRVSFSLDSAKFERASIRGTVDLETILYLDRPGTFTAYESYLAKSSGCILGHLDRCTLVIDGLGSEFPIFIMKKSGAPLWNINCKWVDPTKDAFFDTVEISLNAANQNYKYIDQSNPEFNVELLKEIMASALGIVISKLRESDYWDDTINHVDVAPGSVSEAVYYYYNSLNWNVYSPEATSASIRKFLDKRLGK